MRAILTVVAVLAVAWCGWWFLGARIVMQQAEGALAEARAQGYRAEVADLAVRGFPNRFDLTVTAPDLADPASGFGWTAPFVQVFALTWQPWHVIAAFAPEQQVTTPAGVFTLTAGKLQASLRARPAMTLPLDRMTLIGTDLAVLAPGGQSLSTPELRLATRDLDGTGLRHEVGLEVTGLAPGPGLLPEGTGLPAVLDLLRLDADLTFSAPVLLNAPGTRPELTGLSLGEALLVWGDLALHARGDLVPDAAGLAEGSLTLRATNWQRVLPALVEAGLVKPEVAQTWTRMLEIMAAQSGDPAVIDLTLRFAQGRVSLGPLPLGPAPRLR
jgi:hypothetical protein